MSTLELLLQRAVKLVGKEDNTQCIAAVKKGYSPSLRYMQRHCRTSLGFAHEVFYHDPDDGELRYWSILEYVSTKDQRGDWMTKQLDRAAFLSAREFAGIR